MFCTLKNYTRDKEKTQMKPRTNTLTILVLIGLLLSAAPTIMAQAPDYHSPVSVTADGVFAHYLSKIGDPNYNSDFDIAGPQGPCPEDSACDGVINGADLSYAFVLDNQPKVSASHRMWPVGPAVPQAPMANAGTFVLTVPTNILTGAVGTYTAEFQQGTNDPQCPGPDVISYHFKVDPTTMSVTSIAMNETAGWTAIAASVKTDPATGIGGDMYNVTANSGNQPLFSATATFGAAGSYVANHVSSGLLAATAWCQGWQYAMTFNTPQSSYIIAPATLQGDVWGDSDRDGVRDAGEPALTSATITVKLGGSTIATPTLVNGHWSVGNLAPGTYSVELTALPPDYGFTTGTTPTSVTLAEGETKTVLMGLVNDFQIRGTGFIPPFNHSFWEGQAATVLASYTAGPNQSALTNVAVGDTVAAILPNQILASPGQANVILFETWTAVSCKVYHDADFTADLVAGNDLGSLAPAGYVPVDPTQDGLINPADLGYCVTCYNKAAGSPGCPAALDLNHDGWISAFEASVIAGQLRAGLICQPEPPLPPLVRAASAAWTNPFTQHGTLRILLREAPEWNVDATAASLGINNVDLVVNDYWRAATSGIGQVELSLPVQPQGSTVVVRLAPASFYRYHPTSGLHQLIAEIRPGETTELTWSLYPMPAGQVTLRRDSSDTITVLGGSDIFHNVGLTLKLDVANATVLPPQDSPLQLHYTRVVTGTAGTTIEILSGLPPGTTEPTSGMFPLAQIKLPEGAPCRNLSITNVNPEVVLGTSVQETTWQANLACPVYYPLIFR